MYGKVMPGVTDILEFLKGREINTGFSSNLPFKFISVVLKNRESVEYFEAVSSEHEKKGKPSADVYLSTAKKLGFPFCHYLAFEDSFQGVLPRNKRR